MSNTRHFGVRLEPLGLDLVVGVGESVVHAAERIGVALPTSCRNGTCRHCMAWLAQGQVSYPIPWPGLSAEEKSKGWILPCVARPESDLVLHLPSL